MDKMFPDKWSKHHTCWVCQRVGNCTASFASSPASDPMCSDCRYILHREDTLKNMAPIYHPEREAMIDRLYYLDKALNS